jgi:hypothetical protein
MNCTEFSTKGPLVSRHSVPGANSSPASGVWLYLSGDTKVEGSHLMNHMSSEHAGCEREEDQHEEETGRVDGIKFAGRVMMTCRRSKPQHSFATSSSRSCT